MLQMVKTLAQFTIALEDMRDLGPAATASGEPASGEPAENENSGADSEEPGEAQVPGKGRGSRKPEPRPGTQLTQTWGKHGQMLGRRTERQNQSSCLATGLGTQ